MTLLKKTIIALILLTLTPACSHLFYYPDGIIYSDPRTLGFEYKDVSQTENYIKKTEK
jgi:hypothetical protein